MKARPSKTSGVFWQQIKFEILLGELKQSGAATVSRDLLQAVAAQLLSELLLHLLSLFTE